MTWSPLACGIISGKYDSGVPPSSRASLKVISQPCEKLATVPVPHFLSVFHSMVSFSLPEAIPLCFWSDVASLSRCAVCLEQGYQWLKDKILSEEGRRQQTKLKELQAIAERLGCTLPQLAIGTQAHTLPLSLFLSVCPSVLNLALSAAPQHAFTLPSYILSPKTGGCV